MPTNNIPVALIEAATNLTVAAIQKEGIGAQPGISKSHTTALSEAVAELYKTIYKAVSKPSE